MREFSPEWFDSSSKAWRENKKRVGESWIYICKKPNCNKRVALGEESCKSHTSHIKLTTHETQSNMGYMTLRPRKYVTYKE